MFKRLFGIDPVNLLYVAFAVQGVATLLGFAPGVALPTLLIVMGLAYAQNSSYALQSRAGMRNSNAYHLIAAVAASLTFFWSLQLLVSNRVPLILLVPYTLVTVLATLHGNRLADRVERFFGIWVPDKERKGKAEFMKLWPSVAVLAVLLVAELVYLANRPITVVTPANTELVLGFGTLVLLVVLSGAGSLTFAVLRTSRSSDSYWFHAAAYLANIILEFVRLAIMVKFKLNWALFLPVTLGSVIGSLIGANLAQGIIARIKASFDVHVYSKDEEKARERTGDIPVPTRQIAFLGGLMAVQVGLIAAGYAVLAVTLTLFLLNGWKEMSFTLKSRAGQRNDARYLAWASVFSNGVWYVTMNPLIKDGIGWDKALPYILGGVIGSLLGQLVAMRIERATGAVVNAPVAVPKAATA